MRVAVLGLGAVSRYYLDAIEREPEIDLVAVCDVSPARTEPFRDILPCYADHMSLLRDLRPDGVVVTLPNDLHAPVCRHALESGAAVCVEKPLARTAGEAHELDRLSRDLGIPLFTAFHRRHNSGVLELRSFLRTRAPAVAITVRYFERIEEHTSGETWYLDPFRCGGGCVADNGPNAFDLVRMFLGPVEVSDVHLRPDLHGVDRYAVVSLHATGGGTASVELDWSYPGERKEIEVRLADGSCYRVDMLDGYPGFKESLWHEYRSIVSDFAASVRSGSGGSVAGLAATQLVHTSYAYSGASGSLR